MVLDGSGEVQPGIEEAWNSCFVLGEELDDGWRTKDSWVGLMNGSFHGGGLGITGDDNSLLFELMWLLSRNFLSWGLLGEDLDDCWQTEDSWGGLMTELFNVRETDITGNDISILFEWQLLQLNPRLSRGVVCRLPWLFPVPLLWHLPRPFLERGMTNKIWVCGDIVCLVFYLSITIISWQPNFWRNYCRTVLLYVPGIKIDYKLLVSKSS